MRAFIALAQAPASGFFRPLPFETGRKREAGQLAGRWLLFAGGEGEHGAPILSVEAQAYFRQFRVLHVNVGSASGGLPETAVAALSLMVSALMILTRCDVLKVIGGTAETARALAALGWGDERPAWSPRDTLTALGDGGGPVGVTRALVSVDPFAWWETEHGARDKQILSYLEKRMDMAERREPGRVVKRRLFTHLSRFLRWK